MLPAPSAPRWTKTAFCIPFQNRWTKLAFCMHLRDSNHGRLVSARNLPAVLSDAFRSTYVKKYAKSKFCPAISKVYAGSRFCPSARSRSAVLPRRWRTARESSRSRPRPSLPATKKGRPPRSASGPPRKPSSVGQPFPPVLPAGPSSFPLASLLCRPYFSGIGM